MFCVTLQTGNNNRAGNKFTLLHGYLCRMRHIAKCNVEKRLVLKLNVLVCFGEQLPNNQ